jgi:hypothetical protein
MQGIQINSILFYSCRSEQCPRIALVEMYTNMAMVVPQAGNFYT